MVSLPRWRRISAWKIRPVWAECPTSPKACVVVNTSKKIPPRKVPKRNQQYLTDVPGIYIIGDVSGVPLIKNAITECASVIEYVVEDLRSEGPVGDLEYDIAIIGAGPAGFSAAVCASERGLKYVALDQKRVGSTIRDYPAGKYIFFKPTRGCITRVETAGVKGLVPLPGVGSRKEDLLPLWDELAGRIQVREMERCTAIESLSGGFQIKTQAETEQTQNVSAARRVILAIGNLGSPMKLGVMGEDMQIPFGPEGKMVSKVNYSLSDPSEYVFTRQNEVTLAVRSDFKGDLKLGNKMNIFDCMDAGRIKVHFHTSVKEIGEREVVLADAKS